MVQIETWFFKVAVANEYLLFCSDLLHSSILLKDTYAA